MDARIERVTDLDSVWPVLTALLLELHEHHQPFWPRDFLPDWQERWRTYLTSADDRCIIIAWQDGEAIGYANAAIRRDPGLFRETFAHIDDAYVRPDSRRLGVGARMLEEVEAWCRSRGVDEVRLGVVAANEIGLRFWQKSGFQPLSHTMSKRLAAS